MKEYEVQIGGLTHTMQLSPEDAERYGVLAVPKHAAPETDESLSPENKAGKPANK